MVTEKEIIYSLINTIRNGDYNNDENLVERLLRTYLNTYRVASLRKQYNNGLTTRDEVFQTIPLELSQNGTEFIVELPKIIQLGLNGVRLEKMSFPIPVLDSESYRLSKKDYFGQHKPKAKTDQNTLTLYIGYYDSCCMEPNSELATIIKALKNEALSTKVSVDLKAILYNPSDDPTYDWETSIYPFPAERIEELKGTILAKEYGVMMKSKSDEIQNARADNIRYHDNDDVAQNG